MATNQIEAMDAMLGLVKTVWDANADPTRLYYDNQDVSRPDDPATFGRAIIQHSFGTQITLSNPGHGARVMRRSGQLFVQIFTPQNDGQRDIRVLSDEIAFVLEDAPASVGVRLTNVSINELGSDGTYYQVNVTSDFSYDRIS
jgi:hypothetical protein